MPALSLVSREQGPRRYSMADGDRGEMFAELERACDELDRALEQLKKAGYTLREFSKGLETDPTGILLTHYPNGYMIYPDEINKTPWEYPARSEEHTSELQSPYDLVCRLLL